MQSDDCQDYPCCHICSALHGNCSGKRLEQIIKRKTGHRIYDAYRKGYDESHEILERIFLSSRSEKYHIR